MKPRWKYLMVVTRYGAGIILPFILLPPTWLKTRLHTQSFASVTVESKCDSLHAPQIPAVVDSTTSSNSSSSHLLTNAERSAQPSVSDESVYGRYPVDSRVYPYSSPNCRDSMQGMTSRRNVPPVGCVAQEYNDSLIGRGTERLSTDIRPLRQQVVVTY